MSPLSICVPNLVHEHVWIPQSMHVWVLPSVVVEQREVKAWIDKVLRVTGVNKGSKVLWQVRVVVQSAMTGQVIVHTQTGGWRRGLVLHSHIGAFGLEACKPNLQSTTVQVGKQKARTKELQFVFLFVCFYPWRSLHLGKIPKLSCNILFFSVIHHTVSRLLTSQPCLQLDFMSLSLCSRIIFRLASC